MAACHCSAQAAVKRKDKREGIWTDAKAHKSLSSSKQFDVLAEKTEKNALSVRGEAKKQSSEVKMKKTLSR